MSARSIALLGALLFFCAPLAACAQEGGEERSGDAAAAAEAAARPGAQELERLWRDGRTYAAFVGDVRRREETWRANTARAAPPADLLERLGAVEGRWRLLAVAEGWCGDSAHTLPYVAALADAVPSLDLRIVDSREGRAVTEAHRTPDGREATPTFVLMDEEGRDRGCFVERPPSLQAWYLSLHDSVGERELHAELIDRYEDDEGGMTMDEIVTVIEAAARGDRRCVGASPDRTSPDRASPDQTGPDRASPDTLSPSPEGAR